MRRPNARERLREESTETHFGRMCQKLGIPITTANSPQAKGACGKGALARIRTVGEEAAVGGDCQLQGANPYLEEHYIAEHNRRYARLADA